jgi:hypothetical protein
MTVLGKVLVFVNLAFSVAVAALIMMAYVARTNWAAGYNDVKKKYEVELARVATLEEELKKAEDAGDAKERAVQAKLAQATKELQAVQSTAKDMQEQLTRKETEFQKAGIGSANVQAEVNKLSQQAQRAQQLLADANKRLDDQAKEVSKMRDRAVSAEIENRTLKDRNDQLARVLEEREKDIVRIKATPTGNSLAANAPNPPPGNVEGLVKNFDPSSGLLTITIGSDSGILKGHTLEVYRLTPNGRYVGTMRVMDVRPNEAVGKMVSKPLAPVQVGDKVASKIS